MPGPRGPRFSPIAVWAGLDSGPALPSVSLHDESFDHSGHHVLCSVVIIHRCLPREWLLSAVAPVKVKDYQKEDFCGQHGPHAMSQSWRVTAQGSTFKALRNPAENKGMVGMGGVPAGGTMNLV